MSPTAIPLSSLHQALEVVRSKRFDAALEMALVKAISKAEIYGKAVLIYNARPFNFAERLGKLKHFNPDTIPPGFLDPISQEIMNDPITLETGHTYDRKTLYQHFSSLRRPSTFTCPISRGLVTPAEFNKGTSILIKNFIETFVKEQEVLDQKEEMKLNPKSEIRPCQPR